MPVDTDKGKYGAGLTNLEVRMPYVVKSYLAVGF